MNENPPEASERQQPAEPSNQVKEDLKGTVLEDRNLAHQLLRDAPTPQFFFFKRNESNF